MSLTAPTAAPIFLNRTTAISSPQVSPALGTTATFVASGTFDGATAFIQVSPDGGTTWVGLEDTALTAPGARNVEVGMGLMLRVVLASTGGGTSVSAWLAYAT